MRQFELVSDYRPTGDQPNTIRELVEGLERGDKYQTLLGITGSGKGFCIANVIAQTQRPALIMAPNKTLAAQLYNEFKDFFPHNAVEFFVSYYDYYQPEAYIPSSDTYIEKDANINDAIDRMRHAATHSLLTRSDVIIIASVSCIYGIGSADAYFKMSIALEVGHQIERDALLRKLVGSQYERNDIDFTRGTFRVRGDCVEVFPAYEGSRAIRVQLFGDEIEAISEIDPLRGKIITQLDKVSIFPATHYVVTDEHRHSAIKAIREELTVRLAELRNRGRFLEASRLEQRVTMDLEQLITLGFCYGVENYSRHLSDRAEGEPGATLLDYFASNYLLIIDESHIGVSQIGGMYRGDRSRKSTLVEYGFRLPSALDNRPLNFEEFTERIGQCIFVSATPGNYEIEQSEGVVVEQIIRPTGLLDPRVEIRPAKEQVDDALEEILVTVAKGFRVLVTTLTKRMSEDLTEYFTDLDLKVRYLHSDIDTLERTAILRDLRRGVFDILVGINLLREGLDLPEVALVIILDADKEGFLRSKRSLIQTIGRAARNVEGRVLLYADKLTDSLKAAVEETRRRRTIQDAYNKAHNIEPQTIIKAVHDIESHVPGGVDLKGLPQDMLDEAEEDALIPVAQITARIIELTRSMKEVARELEFELAALYRDRIVRLQQRQLLEG